MNQELETIIKNDDNDRLQQVIAMGTSVDFIFPSVSLTCPQILQDKPPIISFASFYKAENCVNFLIQNGALINIADKEGVFKYFYINFDYQFILLQQEVVYQLYYFYKK